MSAIFSYRRFEARDIAAGTALVLQSGWNQTADDWRIFLDLGEAIAVENSAGRVIATAAMLPHGARCGWISMVLVDAAYRRQGIATRLLRQCIDLLQRGGRIPVLDATPAGRAVYLHLGFRDGWGITRWQAQSPRTASPERAHAAEVELEVRPIQPNDWPAIAALDQRAFGADRLALLQRLHARSRALACVALAHGALQGFALGRDGNRATYVGPVVAQAPAAGEALLAAALGELNGPVYVDALDAHEPLRTLLAARGFTVQRPYTRMALADTATGTRPDQTKAPGDERSMWAIAGPELG